jgi:hypothetical protein
MFENLKSRGASLFFAVAFLSGLSLLAFDAWRLADELRFERRALVLPGVVTDVAGDHAGSSAQGRARIRYVTPAGATETLLTKVSAPFIVFRVGSPVEVLYDQHDGTARLNSVNERFGLVGLLAVVALALVALGALPFALYVWAWGWPTRANRQRHEDRLREYIGRER